MRTIVLLTILTPALYFLSCKPIRQAKVGPGFILGVDNIVGGSKSSHGKGALLASNSSVVIATNESKGTRKICSGTLIKPANKSTNPRVLTNHHCFHEEDKDGNITNVVMPSACVATSVIFGFFDETAKSAKYLKCKDGTLRSTMVGDLSIFEVEGELPSDAVLVDVTTTPPFPDESLLVVHYPNLSRRIASSSEATERLPKASFTLEDCIYKGPFSGAEANIDPSLKFAYQHTCDLDFGSSGSGLWSSDGTKFYGVNWGGIEIKYNSQTKIINVSTDGNFVKHFMDDTLSDFLISKGIDPNQQITSKAIRTNETRSSTKGNKNLVCGE